MDTQKFTKDLSDEGLAALNDAVRTEVKNRSPKVMLESIKPGMTPEQRAAVYAAIKEAGKDL